MIDIAVDVFACGVDAHAQRAFGTEPVAQIGGEIARALFVGAQGHAAHVLGPLGAVVDQPGRFVDARLQPGQTLEELYLLLVFQRDRLFAHRAHAVDTVAVGGIERIAAHHEVFVIANGRIRIASGSIGTQDFTEHACLTIEQLLTIDERDRRGCVQQPGCAESAQCRAGLDALATHVDRIQFDGIGVGLLLRQCRGAAQRQYQRERAAGEQGEGRRH